MSEIEITTVQPKELDFSNLDKEKYMAKKYEAETLENSGEIEPITPETGIENLSIAIDNLEQISICAKKVFCVLVDSDSTSAAMDGNAIKDKLMSPRLGRVMLGFIMFSTFLDGKHPNTRK